MAKDDEGKIQGNWELVYGLREGTYTDCIERIKIFNGWLYRTRKTVPNRHELYTEQISICFVPEK